MRLRLLSLLLLATACGTAGSPGGSDVGDTPADAGTTDVDAGAEPDAGATLADAGEETDAGTPPDAGTNARPSITVTQPDSTVSGRVELAFIVTDAEGDLVDVQVELLDDDGANPRPATLAFGAAPPEALVSSAAGTAHTFAWGTVVDVGKDSVDVKLRLTPRDAGGPGEPVETEAFEVDNGTYLRAELVAPNHPANQVTAGDVDGDGAPDVIVSTPTGALLLRNDGTGHFTVASSQDFPPIPVKVAHVALVDVDADGDLDAVLGVTGGSGAIERRNRLYLNDGKGRFADRTAGRLPEADDQTERVLVADVDGDQDPDLFFLNSGSQQDELLLNDGTGRFTDATSLLPADTLMGSGGAFADVDGDRDPDLLFVNFITSQGFRLYLNDGTGTFGDATGQRLPAQRTGGLLLDAVANDYDADGDADFYLVDGLTNGVFLVSGGNGAFSYGASPDVGGLGGVSACFGDVDLDGRTDLFVTKTSHPNVLLRQRSSGFSAASSTMFSDTATYHRGCAAADFDRDGDVDFFVAVDANAGSKLWRNQETR